MRFSKNKTQKWYIYKIYLNKLFYWERRLLIKWAFKPKNIQYNYIHKNIINAQTVPKRDYFQIHIKMYFQMKKGLNGKDLPSMLERSLRFISQHWKHTHTWTCTSAHAPLCLLTHTRTHAHAHIHTQAHTHIFIMLKLYCMTCFLTKQDPWSGYFMIWI